MERIELYELSHQPSDTDRELMISLGEPQLLDDETLWWMADEPFASALDTRWLKSAPPAKMAIVVGSRIYIEWVQALMCGTQHVITFEELERHL